MGRTAPHRHQFKALGPLEALHTLDQAGSVFLTRLAVRTTVYLAPDTRIDLGRWLRRQHARCLDQPFWIGVRHRLPVRLLATRVRWQIELRFKLWQDQGG